MREPASGDVLSRRSPRMFGLFRGYARRYAARHLHAVRVSRVGPVPDLPDVPVVVVLNHPSWWDPLIALTLTGFMPDERIHFAPIDSVGLAQYPFLSRLGFFELESGTASGASRFLRTSLSILSRRESVLWITAQGEFIDSRRRPTHLRPGIGHLAHRLTEAAIVPMALDYPFWNDRCPEALVRFGRPIVIGDGRSRSHGEWTAEIGRCLEREQDALAIEAMGRNPVAFTTLVEGTAGVGGVYDTWRRMRAWLAGRTFRPEHATRPTADAGSRPLWPPPTAPDGRTPTE